MRVVRVDWRDATGGVRSGWRPLSEIIKSSKVAPAVSYGAVLKDEDDAITICPHFAGNTLEDGDGDVTIPKEWVTKITDLKPVKAKKAKNPKADVVAE